MGKAARDERRSGWDERRARLARLVRSHRDLALGWAIISAVAAAVCLLNVLGFAQHEGGGVGAHLIFEGSSWLAITLLAWTPWAVLRATEGRPWWMKGSAHLAAALGFFAAHMGLFTLFRAGLFAAAGMPYDPMATIENLPFEAGKDVIAYGMSVGGYLFIGFMIPRPSASAEPRALFDIRDGARLVRVALSDVLAVSAAGNYVEFHLRDGRRPLMRSSLSALAGELETAGFLRTHRSWLVNGAAVTGLTPEGSGDYRIELGGVSAPLSRRYRGVLARLMT